MPPPRRRRPPPPPQSLSASSDSDDDADTDHGSDSGPPTARAPPASPPAASPPAAPAPRRTARPDLDDLRAQFKQKLRRQDEHEERRRQRAAPSAVPDPRALSDPALGSAATSVTAESSSSSDSASSSSEDEASAAIELDAHEVWSQSFCCVCEREIPPGTGVLASGAPVACETAAAPSPPHPARSISSRSQTVVTSTPPSAPGAATPGPSSPPSPAAEMPPLGTNPFPLARMQLPRPRPVRHAPSLSRESSNSRNASTGIATALALSRGLSTHSSFISESTSTGAEGSSGPRWDGNNASHGGGNVNVWRHSTVGSGATTQRSSSRPTPPLGPQHVRSPQPTPSGANSTHSARRAMVHDMRRAAAQSHRVALYCSVACRDEDLRGSQNFGRLVGLYSGAPTPAAYGHNGTNYFSWSDAAPYASQGYYPPSTPGHHQAYSFSSHHGAPNAWHWAYAGPSSAGLYGPRYGSAGCPPNHPVAGNKGLSSPACSDGGSASPVSAQTGAGDQASWQAPRHRLQPAAGVRRRTNSGQVTSPLALYPAQVTTDYFDHAAPGQTPAPSASTNGALEASTAGRTAAPQSPASMRSSVSFHPLSSPRSPVYSRTPRSSFGAGAALVGVMGQSRSVLEQERLESDRAETAATGETPKSHQSRKKSSARPRASSCGEVSHTGSEADTSPLKLRRPGRRSSGACASTSHDHSQSHLRAASGPLGVGTATSARVVPPSTSLSTACASSFSRTLVPPSASLTRAARAVSSGGRTFTSGIGTSWTASQSLSRSLSRSLARDGESYPKNGSGGQAPPQLAFSPPGSLEGVVSTAPPAPPARLNCSTLAHRSDAKSTSTSLVPPSSGPGDLTQAQRYARTTGGCGIGTRSRSISSVSTSSRSWSRGPLASFSERVEDLARDQSDESLDRAAKVPFPALPPASGHSNTPDSPLATGHSHTMSALETLRQAHQRASSLRLGSIQTGSSLVSPRTRKTSMPRAIASESVETDHSGGWWRAFVPGHWGSSSRPGSITSGGSGKLPSRSPPLPPSGSAQSGHLSARTAGSGASAGPSVHHSTRSTHSLASDSASSLVSTDTSPPPPDQDRKAGGAEGPPATSQGSTDKFGLVRPHGRRAVPAYATGSGGPIPGVEEEGGQPSYLYPPAEGVDPTQLRKRLQRRSWAEPARIQPVWGHRPTDSSGNTTPQHPGLRSTTPGPWDGMGLRRTMTPVAMMDSRRTSMAHMSELPTSRPPSRPASRGASRVPSRPPSRNGSAIGGFHSSSYSQGGQLATSLPRRPGLGWGPSRLHMPPQPMPPVPGWVGPVSGMPMEYYLHPTGPLPPASPVPHWAGCDGVATPTPTAGVPVPARPQPADEKTHQAKASSQSHSRSLPVHDVYDLAWTEALGLDFEKKDKSVRRASEVRSPPPFSTRKASVPTKAPKPKAAHPQHKVITIIGGFGDLTEHPAEEAQGDST